MQRLAVKQRGSPRRPAQDCCTSCCPEAPGGPVMSTVHEVLTIPRMTRPAVQLSIVVPTYREAENLELLIDQVFKAVSGAGLAAEMIIVDDNSQDGSAAIVASAQAEHDVRIIVREHE